MRNTEEYREPQYEEYEEERDAENPHVLAYFSILRNEITSCQTARTAQRWQREVGED